MRERTRQRIVDGDVWLRGFFMLLYLIAYNIAEFIIVLLSIFQFIAVLITGRANEPLLEFGNNLSVYIYEIFQFLTFNSEIRPFPFSPWPDEETSGGVWLEDDDLDSSQPAEETADVVIESEATEVETSDRNDATGDIDIETPKQKDQD